MQTSESRPGHILPPLSGCVLLFWLILWSTLSSAETVHVVERGQTVTHLARMYGMSVRAICQANGVSDPNLIRIGQRLVIPEYDPFTGAVRGELDRSTLGTHIVRREAALDNFYRKLAALENGGEEQVRILVLGDSHIYADFFTGQVRRELQARYGDGGRGFVIPATHPRDPGQQGVDLTTSAEWIALKEWPADSPRPFGLPMKRHVALQQGAELSFTLADTAAASTVEVWYLA
ncbi:MAG: LysM peptidoglycan-binding domain-containing protein, partial [bacterium]